MNKLVIPDVSYHEICSLYWQHFGFLWPLMLLKEKFTIVCPVGELLKNAHVALLYIIHMFPYWKSAFSDCAMKSYDCFVLSRMGKSRVNIQLNILFCVESKFCNNMRLSK